MNKSIGLAVLILAIVATGCARTTTTPENPVRAEYYPRCNEPLAYLHERASSGGTGRAIAGGAIQGAVISGIAGAIITAIAGGGFRAGTVLASTGIGAAIGGVAAGANHASGNSKEDNRHLAQYLEEIDGDIEGMDIVQAAATFSKQCYAKEFKQLVSNLNTMPQDTARARLSEILAGNAEAAQLLKTPANNFIYVEEFNTAARKAYK